MQTGKLSLTALFAMQKSRFVPTIVSILLFTVGNLEFLVFPRLLLVLCTFFILTGMQCNWDEKACISLLLRRLPSKVAVSLAKLHLPLQVTARTAGILLIQNALCRKEQRNSYAWRPFHGIEAYDTMVPGQDTKDRTVTCKRNADVCRMRREYVSTDDRECRTPVPGIRELRSD